MITWSQLPDEVKKRFITSSFCTEVRHQVTKSKGLCVTEDLDPIWTESIYEGVWNNLDSHTQFGYLMNISISIYQEWKKLKTTWRAIQDIAQSHFS